MQLQVILTVFVMVIQTSMAMTFPEDDFLWTFDPISSGSSRRSRLSSRESKSKKNSLLSRPKSIDDQPFVPHFPAANVPRVDDSVEVIFNPNFKKKATPPPKRKHSYEDFSSEEATSTTTTTTPSTTTTTSAPTTTPAPTTTSTTPFPIAYNDTNPDSIVFDGPVYQGELPGYAVFLYQPYPFCGGTLVTQRHVLTAGHCFYKLLQAPGTISRVRVYVNTVTLVPVSSETVVRAVRNVYVHPKFDEGAPGKFLKNDIALVELDEEVGHVRRTRLPKRIENYDKELISLFGFNIRPWTFGFVSGLHPTTDYFLKYLSSNVISNDLCASAWGDDTLKDHQYICTTANRGPCFGDSGAPVLSDGLGQIAVTSYKYWHCQADLPAVHTRIAPYKDWITYIVDDD